MVSSLHYWMSWIYVLFSGITTPAQMKLSQGAVLIWDQVDLKPDVVKLVISSSKENYLRILITTLQQLTYATSPS